MPERSVFHFENFCIHTPATQVERKTFSYKIFVHLWNCVYAAFVDHGVLRVYHVLTNVKKRIFLSFVFFSLAVVLWWWWRVGRCCVSLLFVVLSVCAEITTKLLQQCVQFSYALLVPRWMCVTGIATNDEDDTDDDNNGTHTHIHSKIEVKKSLSAKSQRAAFLCV